MSTPSYDSDDPSERLRAVRQAIGRCLTSQEYQTADGRRQQAAELRDLRKMEKELQDEVAASQSAEGGGISLGYYERH